MATYKKLTYNDVPVQVENAKSVLDSKTNAAIKIWRGSKAEYDALDTIDPNTVYYTTDEYSSLSTVASTGSYTDLLNRPTYTTYELAVENWVEEDGKLTYTLEISGLTIAHNLLVSPAANSSAEEMAAIKAAKIEQIIQDEGAVRFIASGSAPSINVSVLIRAEV